MNVSTNLRHDQSLLTRKYVKEGFETSTGSAQHSPATNWSLTSQTPCPSISMLTAFDQPFRLLHLVSLDTSSKGILAQHCAIVTLFCFASSSQHCASTDATTLIYTSFFIFTSQDYAPFLALRDHRQHALATM